MNQPQKSNASAKTNTLGDQESTDDIEQRPDAEERFRKAVHAAAKSGPKHRPSKEAKR